MSQKFFNGALFCDNVCQAGLVVPRSILTKAMGFAERYGNHMSDDPSLVANGPQKLRIVWTVTQIAAIWSASDAGYYYLLPALGVQPNYNGGLVAITLYYAFWI